MAHKMKKPKTGGTPKRITTKNAPGGSRTPGAKKKKNTSFRRKPERNPY